MFLLLLVLDAIQYSYPAHWYASYREPCRSKINAVQTAIEYEHDEIRCEARSLRISLHTRPRTLVLKATVNKGPRRCSSQSI
ncbi:MAG: hypothetical protein DWH99_17705 [Planctomycetota bacterium]|nr:MAG: hypothetical protein DWH99_17705 [Planctomycetota bacterium]